MWKFILLILLPMAAHGQDRIAKSIRRPEAIQCASSETENQELTRVWHNIDSLKQIQPVQFQTKSTIRFRWPVQWVNQTEGNSFFGLSNYVDHNPAFNAVRDFNCGVRTYNTSNYNHKGTDIYLWPAWWKMMADGEVNVVAAAKGRIVYRVDGNFDRQCNFNSSNWNAVYLQHSDSLITWYGHLKKNSVTTKQVGDTVSEGEYLGKVGSSGNSTGPHLHFEVYDSGILRDPYNGPCNNSQPSLWQEQHPYFNRDLIRSFCTNGEPVFPPCPQVENLKKDSIYLSGDSVYLTNYYRDLVHNDTTTLLLFSPSGNRIDSVQTIHDLSPDPFWDAGGWLWKYGPEVFVEEGAYSFHSRYRGETMKAAFLYGNPSTRSKQKSFTKIRLAQDNNGIRIMGNFDKMEVFDSQKRPLSFQMVEETSRTRIIEHWAKGLVIFRIYTGDQILHFKVLK
jgi:murein DD-endopeptidase MepM/ murein hydrolase activator NlpD